MKTELTTLCYLEREEKYLMLHRVKKADDINEGKWIGVGGHFEERESPEECLVREVREETGYTLQSWKYRGIVTFISGEDVTEYMHLFTSDDFTGKEIDCDEGVLSWIPKEHVGELSLWPGDRIFLRLIKENRDFFSLKLVYDSEGRLLEAKLDGRKVE